MWRFATKLILLLAVASCGPVTQPKSAQTVAAFEVALPTEGERARFLQLLAQVAESEGFHVDARTADELRVESEIAPMTINAAVWRGENDDEPIANVLDVTRPGYAWLTFSLGENPSKSRRFQTRAMKAIRAEWPSTKELPIVNGGIPNPRDLILIGSSYVLDPKAAATYATKS